MKNRLNLDFSLVYRDERVEFVNNYLPTLIAPTDTELETMGDYILYGRERGTDLNAVEQHEVIIETKSKTWDSRPETSLEALVESPEFTEGVLRPLGSAPPTRVPRTKLDRDLVREEHPELEALWRQIDEVELGINLWELEHGKRKKPPR